MTVTVLTLTAETGHDYYAAHQKIAMIIMPCVSGNYRVPFIMGWQSGFIDWELPATQRDKGFTLLSVGLSALYTAVAFPCHYERKRDQLMPISTSYYDGTLSIQHTLKLSVERRDVIHIETIQPIVFLPAILNRPSSTEWCSA